MAKYLYVYHGGSDPETEEEVAEVLDAWGNWLGSMGAAVIDGGNPVGRSSTVNPDGSVTDDGGANPASGYSLIEAADFDDALAKAKGCPILQAGGSIEVAEVIDM
ncbi:MAG: YciI family protein [Gammaproteobacteria bacterium]|nr:YciI family protein [Gammaproteobacteria bacterium]MDH5618946.1 YciI family protein [Gammaproteobacteria bacterium]